MRITIIEMAPEELNRFGTVEDLTDQVATASLSDKSDKSDKSDPSLLRCAVASKSDEIKVFGQELWGNGDATLRDLVTLTMEHFGLSTADFARIIGTTPSTVSLFLNHGQCLEAVLLACTNFFGYGGSPESTQRPAKPGEQSQLVTAEACGDGTTATATFGGNII